MTTCLMCGHEMVKSRESFHETSTGLPHVTFVGAETWRCPSCGEHSVVYPQLAEYLRAIAQELLQKGSRLTGEEVRYLRKHMQWSGVQLAKHLGVSAESVSRWENGREVIGATTDRLMRLVVALQAGLRYEVGALVGIEEKPVPARIVLAHVAGNGWVRADLPKPVRAARAPGKRAKRKAA